MNKKNILLITTDQQSSTMMSCTGNTDLKTPNLDSIASDGIRFERAYVAQPLCLPQRCSWYTGLMPHEHGTTFNVSKDLNTPSVMGEIFKNAGYATGYSGKWHINIPETDKDRHGFEWTNNLCANGADKGIATDFETFLNENEGKPFVFSASFNNPHNICEAARGGPFPDGNPGIFENLKQLPDLPDNFDIPENEPTIIREVQEIYKKNNYPVTNWDKTRWQIHRWYYCRLVELVDKHIGSLIDILKKNDLEKDTVIIFSSDHGDGNAHHQWNQKQVLYDESIKVPFMISLPGSKMNKVENRQLISTGIDLIPTMCGVTGVDCPEHLKGNDWSDMINHKEQAPVRDHVIVETEFGIFGKPAGYLGRAVCSENYKYMVYDSGKNREFFVDIVNDPGETINLANNPEFSFELDRHRQFLRDYINQSKDIFPIDLVSNK
jgi:arylsulfatase A-like enzyme